MAGIDQPSFAFMDKRICDPFCGVVGFLVEMLNMNDRMMESYSPNSDGRINPTFVIKGFDKGFERDDERTVILAKANMLIYLAEILFQNSQFATEFARVFNDTFTLFRDNLGTFGHIVKKEEEKFDIIMSNPPYVTSGSSIIKEEIAKTPHTATEYPVSGLGLESLSLEWIVKSLKKGGKAYVIIPDGILGRVHGRKLRDHILRKCFLDAIVSLPTRTFFANFERTYIIALTKKHDETEVQSHPVFTYLVSNIGERLTSVGREEIEDDDLPDMERLFKIFSATKNDAMVPIEAHPRCKIQPVDRFRDEPHWVVDRWWSPEEKSGLEKNATEAATKSELDAAFDNLQSSIAEYEQLATFAETLPDGRFKSFSLGDKEIFTTFIRKRVLKSEVSPEGNIPVYSANVFMPMGYATTTRIEDFGFPSILWGIDGNFDFNVIPIGVPFETTDHCGTIRILKPEIVPEYVLYTLHLHRQKENYNRSFRASLANIRRIEISIPVTDDDNLNVERQQEVADKFMALQGKAEEIKDIKANLNERLESYLKATRLK
jgi:type I restriction-modification system DNA methylase subunit